MNFPIFSKKTRYLTSFAIWTYLWQISDDDRMSLTTAISEDDDAESVHNSPYKVKNSTVYKTHPATREVLDRWMLRWFFQLGHAGDTPGLDPLNR